MPKDRQSKQQSLNVSNANAIPPSGLKKTFHLSGLSYTTLNGKVYCSSFVNDGANIHFVLNFGNFCKTFFYYKLFTTQEMSFKQSQFVPRIFSIKNFINIA